MYYTKKANEMNAFEQIYQIMLKICGTVECLMLEKGTMV